MRLFRTFRDNQALLRKSATYAAALMQEPASDDVAWLSEAATRGDQDHAMWELRYLRRAVGILIAQRDSLDDRTPSEALRALEHRMEKDRNVDAQLHELSLRQFNARLSAYRDAFSSKGIASGATRIAQNLLAFSGGPIRQDHPAVVRGTSLVNDYMTASSGVLEATYGRAQLPEDVAPSKVKRT